MDWRTSDAPQELIPDYATLLAWSKARRTLAGRAIARLGVQGKQKAAAAIAVTQQAHALRGEIWKAAEALCRGDRVPLEPINRILAAVPAQPRLMRDDAGYVHDLPGTALEEVLWPVLWSLTALLSSDDAGRLGCCQAQGCGWFFVDRESQPLPPMVFQRGLRQSRACTQGLREAAAKMTGRPGDFADGALKPLLHPSAGVSS